MTNKYQFFNSYAHAYNAHAYNAHAYNARAYNACTHNAHAYKITFSNKMTLALLIDNNAKQ